MPRGETPRARFPRTRAPSPLLAWIRREAVSLLGVVGAALTVLAELAAIVPMVPPLARGLDLWRGLMERFWQPPFELIGVPLHPDIVSALNIALFLILIGIGARLSAVRSGKPLAPIGLRRFLDDQTWPSLVVFGALCFVFLVGGDTRRAATPLELFGSDVLGRYSFAILVTAGYVAGDLIGHRAFHVRLYRLAALVTAALAVNAIFAAG